MQSAIKAGTLLVLLAACTVVQAHSGGLDKHGCHTNRTTGDYHCHRGGAAPPSTVTPRLAPQRIAPTRIAPASGAFANCSEARAAGAAPVRRGEPGYGPHLDRDDDGIGCEPYRGRR
ncbi:excalibur calcium-binding domain-containing protein [Stenotrophomonas sp. SY1]|uniref:excalibur calcium-binding domain-containing protein n=1 Tax=Stenotrophomonas sp. SY1 TaxID=477235 RepID=UPI001E4C7548|nr:excalibur calcium-binding domain-containing protein [Stenotrophomonas sp. SY1]MCD9088631.1 excalibur calcium-binding domain-containing protein [Stenotrophomonas sp. SY1]